MKMSKVFRGLAFVAALTSATTASAWRGPGNQAFVKVPFTEADGTAFSAETLSGTPQTQVLDIRGFSWMTFYLSALTVTGTINIDLNCSTGPTAADVNYPIQSEQVATGIGTLTDYTARKSVTTSDKWPVTINVVNKGYLQCTFTGTSGTIDAVLYAW
jgi:hypothetical protein